MSLVPSFTATQNIGSPEIIVLNDTSTGADALVTQRRIYLNTAEGTTITPAGVTTAYINWPIADLAISLAVLNTDYSLNINVLWLDVNGVMLYTRTVLYCFSLYAEEFYYSLTQDQTGVPNIISGSTYYTNKMILRVEIDSANQAVSIGGDIYSSQSALDRANYMVANQNTYF